GIALLVVRHGDTPRPAAYLAIFDVILIGAAARIDADFIGLTAVRTDHNSFAVRRAIAERKLLLEAIVGEIDHQSPQPMRCRSVVMCAVWCRPCQAYNPSRLSSDGAPHSGCLIVRAKSAGCIARSNVTQR